MALLYSPIGCPSAAPRRSTRAHVPLKLSVLDQSPIRSGAIPADALAETVRLAQDAERFGVEEIVVLSISHDFGLRVRSYELVAEALGLEARA